MAAGLHRPQRQQAPRPEVVADQVYFGDSQKPAVSEGNAAEGRLPSAPAGEYTDVNEDDGELPF